MTGIVLAGAGDLDALSLVVAEAFHDLPPSPWLVADETARKQVFPAYFRLYLQHGLDAGLVYTTLDRAAVALWFPIGTEPPLPPDGYDERLAAVTRPWTSRFVVFDAALEARHPAGTPHHHLALLGVRPDRQGRGLGGALLDAHHKELDRDGLPAYLESSSPRNRQLYRRRGYIALEPSIELPNGPSLVPMWREPSAPTRPAGRTVTIRNES